MLLFYWIGSTIQKFLETCHCLFLSIASFQRSSIEGDGNDAALLINTNTGKALNRLHLEALVPLYRKRCLMRKAAEFWTFKASFWTYRLSRRCSCGRTTRTVTSATTCRRRKLRASPPGTASAGSEPGPAFHSARRLCWVRPSAGLWGRRRTRGGWWLSRVAWGQIRCNAFTSWAILQVERINWLNELTS